MIVDTNIIEYYKTHSDKETLQEFNLSKITLYSLLDRYNVNHHSKNENIRFTLLNKTNEQKKDSELKRKQTTQEKYGCDNVSQCKEIVDKKSNTIKNYTEEQKQHKLNSFHNTLNSKSEEEKELTKHRKSVATKKYFENLSMEEKKAFSKKMSDVYSSFSEEKKQIRNNKIRDSYKNTCIQKYGVSNTLKLEDVKNKITNTNLELYGVPYYCQTEKCRSAKGGNSSLSKPNLAFRQLLIDNNIPYDTEFNLDTYSYDFLVNNTMLIEVNPTATHNSTNSPFNAPKPYNYHYEKSTVARNNGYRCIHVWDWDNIDKILFLLKEQEVVHARKCEIREVDLKTSKEFLNTYHLQGYVKSDVQIGLYHNNKLISLMTFGRPRYNKKYEIELLRYVSIKKVVGGAEKIFKYYINNYNPSSAISYCDLSKFTGSVYEKLGFKYDGYSVGKHWYNVKTRNHITDNLLRQRGVDQLLHTNYGKGTSNERLMIENGFVEIYDAGQARYVWVKR